MAHTHKKSTHHAPGIPLSLARKLTHHRQLKAKPPAAATTKPTHTKHKPTGHSVGSLLSQEHKKSTATGRKKHHSGITAHELSLIRQWDALYQSGQLAQQVLGGGTPKRKKGSASSTAGKPSGSGHTHKKGAGSTATKHTAKHAPAGHDSRNYTPAPPRPLQPQTTAIPSHPHQT